MNETATLVRTAPAPEAVVLDEHIVEVISDSGEGAQRCGQSLGRDRRAHRQRHLDHGDHPRRDPAAGAKRRRRLGHPHPHRHGAGHQRRRRDRPRRRLQRAGAARPGQGGRAQAGRADPAGEHVARASRPGGGQVLHRDRGDRCARPGFRVYEVPLERECRQLVDDPRKGKNMFVLGLLCSVYSFDPTLGREQVALTFGKKEAKVVQVNQGLFDAGYAWAVEHLDFRYRDPGREGDRAADRGQRQHGAGARRARLGHGHLRHVPDHAGDLGLALPRRRLREGRRARAPGRGRDRGRARSRSAPPTPASAPSRSPPGPGYSLKKEFIGLAVMAEIPLVVVNVQRGGPSHRPADEGRAGRPADDDLRQPRRRAEGRDRAARHRGLLPRDDHRAQDRRVVPHGRGGALGREPRHRAAAVPAAGVRQRLARPAGRPDARCRRALKPYDWDKVTGSPAASSPGSPGGMHTVTGLAHDRASKVAYDPEINEEGLRARSRKLAVLQKTLETPPVVRRPRGRPAGRRLGQHQGRDRGGGGPAARRGAARCRRCTSRFLPPMASGLGEILRGFRR